MSPALSDSGSIDDDELPSEKNASLIMGVSMKEYFLVNSCQ